MREQSFRFLFTKFKAKYLLWLLPDFVYRDVYDPVQGMLALASKNWIISFYSTKAVHWTEVK